MVTLHFDKAASLLTYYTWTLSNQKLCQKDKSKIDKISVFTSEIYSLLL